MHTSKEILKWLNEQKIARRLVLTFSILDNVRMKNLNCLNI